jgi:hypothetical protein
LIFFVSPLILRIRRSWPRSCAQEVYDVVFIHFRTVEIFLQAYSNQNRIEVVLYLLLFPFVIVMMI